jgi:hypothetical protein
LEPIATHCQDTESLAFLRTRRTWTD